MIIDAREFSDVNAPYGPFTIVGAVWNVLSNMKIGQVVYVDSLVNAFGETMGSSSINIAVGAVKGDMAFKCRKTADGKTAICRLK